MSKIAALFSGQGSQYAGMGKELFDQHASVRGVYQCAADILGFDVAAMSFSGSEEELGRTKYAQPLIFTLSVAAYTAAAEQLVQPQAVAGHSLGEVAALWAAGAFSLEDGFRIIEARSQAMEQAAKAEPGAMYAVVGASAELVEQVCGQVEGMVFAVNYNLPTQTVISGKEEAAAQAAELLKEQGAKKVVRLAVNGAFHTPLMNSASQYLKMTIGNISYQPAKLDFYSNLTGDKLAVQDYPEYLARQMVSPVRFVEQMQAMERDGVTHCVEFGPKKTAATFAKKNVKAFAVCNVEDGATLAKAMEQLRG